MGFSSFLCKKIRRKRKKIWADFILPGKRVRFILKLTGNTMRHVFPKEKEGTSFEKKKRD